jgi:probable rRNA maturation factor
MPDPSPTVLFQGVPRSLARKKLRDFAVSVSRTVASGRSFCCQITTDDELRRLNRQFLGHDYATDVLSFPEPSPDGFLGEIAISANRAAEQAREFGHSVEDEVSILLLHGVLHLVGMDHEADRGRMARAERRWRKELGLPSGLIERVRK